MPLQFPNARLLIHDLLIEGQTGSESIARSASQYGLIPSESVMEVQTSSNDFCACMVTAKNVLLKYFESRVGKSASDAINVESIWLNIESSIEQHGRASSTCAQQREYAADKHECARLAPILFDYLLQQINQY